MKSETQTILAYTDRPYEEYNLVLSAVKDSLGQDATKTFEKVLSEELLLTTARRAFRTAIQIAMGEADVKREQPLPALKQKHTKVLKVRKAGA